MVMVTLNKAKRVLLSGHEHANLKRGPRQCKPFKMTTMGLVAFSRQTTYCILFNDINIDKAGGLSVKPFILTYQLTPGRQQSTNG